MSKAASMFRSVTRAISFAGLMILGSWLGAAQGLSQQTTALHPILEIEKQQYVMGEAIRIWVGVSSVSEIPEALRQSCVLHIVRPGGARMDEPVSWPIDGDVSRGWKGGWELRRRFQTPGRYFISFEFARQSTKEEKFEIVPNPFSNTIQARWVFPEDKADAVTHAHRVVLHVENDTGRVLRFAKPGLPGSEVSLQVQAFRPPSSESMFVPVPELLRPQEIPAFVIERLQWTNQAKWPMAVVPGRRSADLQLDLQSCYSFRDGQEYQVTLDLVLTAFIGEDYDGDAELFPLRLPVSATTRLRW